MSATNTRSAAATFRRAIALTLPCAALVAVGLWQPPSPPRHRALSMTIPDAYYASYSPDGSLLVSCDDGEARLWPTDGGEDHPLIPPEGGECGLPIFNHDGTRLLIVNDYYGVVDLWDPINRSHIAGYRPLPEFWEGELLPPEEGDHRMYADFAGPSGRFVLNRREYGEVHSAVTGAPLFRVGHHYGFSPNGRWMLTLSEFFTATVWDLDTGQRAGAFYGLLVGEHSFVVLRPDGRQAIQCGRAPLALWDINTHQPFDIEGATSADEYSWNCQYSDDGRRVLTQVGQSLQISRSDTGAPVLRVAVDADTLACTHWASADDRLVALTHDGILRVWDERPGHPEERLQTDFAEVRHAEFSEDGSLVAVVTDAHEVVVLDARSGEVFAHIPVPRDPTTRIRQFSPNAAVLMTCTEGECVTWNLARLNALWMASAPRVGTGTLGRAHGPRGASME